MTNLIFKGNDFNSQFVNFLKRIIKLKKVKIFQIWQQKIYDLKTIPIISPYWVVFRTLQSFWSNFYVSYMSTRRPSSPHCPWCRIPKSNVAIWQMNSIISNFFIQRLPINLCSCLLPCFLLVVEYSNIVSIPDTKLQEK